MVSDFVFFLVLGATFIVFFLNIGLVDVPQRYKKLFIIIFHILFIVSMFYFLRF